MQRFLFGDTSVRVEMMTDRLTLPPRLRRMEESGSSIVASYHINTVVTVRGIPVELHRRTYEEGSAIFRTKEQLNARSTTLLTTFLTRSARVNPRRSSLGLAVHFAVRVPEYEVDNRFFDDHYEGALLFSDKLNIELSPAVDGARTVKYGWDSRTPNRTSRMLELVQEDGALLGQIPFGSGNVQPGISGNLRITIKPWNM